jgi:hypothetical protein
MNNLPRQKLCEIIAKHSLSLCDDPQRCEGLLRDYCNENSSEVNIIIGSLKERIPFLLQESSDTVPRDVLIAQLTKRLEDNLSMTKDAAKWGVESWAMALEVIPSEGCEASKMREKKPINLSPFSTKSPKPSGVVPKDLYGVAVVGGMIAGTIVWGIVTEEIIWAIIGGVVGMIGGVIVGTLIKENGEALFGEIAIEVTGGIAGGIVGLISGLLTGEVIKSILGVALGVIIGAIYGIIIRTLGRL